ncbi:hypothetical protein GLOTRDRAFT_92319 [Gloeophyllum trabeum ATCC 11539]|uniref:Uncharacterized protein n=1 Tax=Gloeophyllum trabeum (strain ATCC 11539 / FP-39264 / Madison 617) TaxID=670483 RepID=S7QCW4_GLOTA|nr:uncharacterized protein GLOTRDRAFT_92319 [Gloeophyllum trabeum ATCC 11539]EPQ57197.1 hypothetical protein GLOTRDRAFT_92319 [Gloeophyllum trabeum ATCC 11539]
MCQSMPTPHPAIYCPAVKSNGEPCMLCDMTFKGYVLGPDAVVDPLLEGYSPTPTENTCTCWLCTAPKIQKPQPEYRQAVSVERQVKKSVATRVKDWLCANDGHGGGYPESSSGDLPAWDIGADDPNRQRKTVSPFSTLEYVLELVAQWTSAMRSAKPVTRALPRCIKTWFAKLNVDVPNRRALKMLAPDDARARAG